MTIKGFSARQVADQVEITLVSPSGAPLSVGFSVADAWCICQEIGAVARQAQQHAGKVQAERAGVTTSAAPAMQRSPSAAE
jgi:hypothetical protein